MATILHKAATRGHANHGWLDSWHTFSFGGYYNESIIKFGALRVLNDDTVAPGMGFGKHLHRNMEIISIPLEGDLEHSDSMGNTAVLRQGDVQVMSAGTGIQHSEKNKNHDRQVKFLQIWIRPDKQNRTPRYDQKTFSAADLQNKLTTVVSPLDSSDGVQIQQNAWLSLGKLESQTSLTYEKKTPGNGMYIFLLEGDVTVNDVAMNRRDGLGLTEEKTVTITANSAADLLVMNVSMLS